MFQPFPISWESWTFLSSRFKTNKSPFSKLQSFPLSHVLLQHCGPLSESSALYLLGIPAFLSHRKNFLIEIQHNSKYQDLCILVVYCAWDLAACLELHTFLFIPQHKLLWNSHFLPATSLPCSLFSHRPPLTWCPRIALTPSWSPVSNNDCTFPII